MIAKRGIYLEVLTPEGPLLETDGVRWIRVQLRDGQIGILPDHAPLLAELVPAVLVYGDESGTHDLWLNAGILWVHRGGVRILTQDTQEEDLGRSNRDRNERLGRLEKAVSDFLSDLEIAEGNDQGDSP